MYGLGTKKKMMVFRCLSVASNATHWRSISSFFGYKRKNKRSLEIGVQVQCTTVLKTSASSFSIRLPGIVNQLGNVNQASHAEILRLTIISGTRSRISVPGEQGSGRLRQSWLATHNSHSSLLATGNYAIHGKVCKMQKWLCRCYFMLTAPPATPCIFNHPFSKVK